MNNHDLWTDAQRLEGWTGEVRVNLIRLAAILVFYAHHLVTLYFFEDDPTAPASHHAQVTALTAAATAGVFALHVCLVRRWVPPMLKYLATLGDTVLITALLLVVQNPSNTLSVLYFVVIAAAGLRLSLPLVYAAALASIASYVLFLLCAKYWFEAPSEQFPTVPQQVIFVLALWTAAALAGQGVRQARRLVEGNPVIVERSPKQE